jgi:hypothetical protein
MYIIISDTNWIALQLRQFFGIFYLKKDINVMIQ